MTMHVERALVAQGLPDDEQLSAWAAAALAGAQAGEGGELSLRIVDESASAALNKEYRGKDYPTNVLSFPCDVRVPDAAPLLGDIVICAPVVAREATQQHKPLQAHWAHMVVHGCLHLLGFDHTEAAQAENMESLERRILAQLGFADPYQPTES